MIHSILKIVIKPDESHRTMEKAKQIPYRAIALDLDGTLTNHEKVVTPKTREALLKAESRVTPAGGPNLLSLQSQRMIWD